MGARRLLLSVAILGLFAASKSQKQLINPGGPIIRPGNPLPETIRANYYDNPGCSRCSKTHDDCPNCNYVIVSGGLMMEGSKETVCIHLKCNEEVNVTVTIQYYETIITIYQMDKVTEVFETRNFLVPGVVKRETAFLSLQVLGPNTKVAIRKQVIFEKKPSSCIAQKNQPKHIPGDTIHMRYICYDQDMNQVIKKFESIIFMDPNGNYISITKNPVMYNGIVEWSMQLSENARTGQYQAIFTDEAGDTESVYFQVDKIKPPRWDWTMTCPGTFSVLDKTAEISGYTQYTYGKPVPGTAFGQCCRRMPRYGSVGNCFRGIDDLCYNFNTKLDQNGTFTQTLDLNIFRLPMSGPNNNIDCEITVKEEGTDELVTKYCYSGITSTLANIELDYTRMGQYYNRGCIPFNATLKDEKGVPIPNKNITVEIDGIQVKTVTTDENGIASCHIDTSSYSKPNITFVARYYNPDLCYSQDYSGQSYPHAEATLFRLFTPTQSYLRLSAPADEIRIPSQVCLHVDYMLTKEGLGKGENTACLMYYITSRNRLVKCGKISIEVGKRNKGSATINIDVNEDFSTGAEVVVAVSLKCEIISDKAYLRVGTGFRNKMNLTFDTEVAAPGEDVEQIVTATPGSLCGLVTIDSAYRLLNPYDPFNADTIFSSVNTYMYNLQYQEYNLEESDPPCVDPNDVVFCNGGWYQPSSSVTDGESYQDFKGANLMLISNRCYRRYKVCGEQEPNNVYPLYSTLSFAKAAVAGVGGDASTITTVRDDLRNYIWIQTCTVGEDGTATVNTSLTDIIAKWESTGFCISNATGIGLPSKPAYIIATQEFFVSTQMPQNILTKESIVVVLTVTNNMAHCAQVKAGIQKSENDTFEVRSLDGKGEQCICSGQIGYWTLSVTCTTAGHQNISVFAETTKISDTCDGPNNDTLLQHKDVLVMQVIVEPPGIQRELTSSHLMKVYDSEVSVTVSISEPHNTEPGTCRMWITLIGDPMALLAQNLNNLLTQPIFCCDQQALLATAITLVANRLQEKGQLDNSTSEKVKHKLAADYMDMLACFLGNGQCSVYRSTPIPNSWVTLYILQALPMMSNWIYIYQSIMSQSIDYIAAKQNLTTGCIEPEGTPIYQTTNDSMVQLTAETIYILFPLKDNFSNVAGVLDGAMKCLGNVNVQQQQMYTQVCIMRAYAVAGQWDKVDTILHDVQGKVTTEDGETYLECKNTPSRAYPYLSTLHPGDMMCTAILLQVMTQKPNPTQEDMDVMASIVKTLSNQMNRRGGFPNAMCAAKIWEALTDYDRQYGNNETNVECTISREDVIITNITITNENKSQLFINELEPIPGNYTCQTRGRGAPLFQITQNCYLKIDKGANSAFSVVATTAAECNDVTSTMVTLNVTFSYIGNGSECGRTLLLFRTLTGYYYDLSSELIGQAGICEVVMKDFILYLVVDEVKREPSSLILKMYRKDRVETMQASLMVMATLESEESGSASYEHPCSHREEPQEA